MKFLEGLEGTARPVEWGTVPIRPPPRREMAQPTQGVSRSKGNGPGSLRAGGPAPRRPALLRLPCRASRRRRARKPSSPCDLRSASEEDDGAELQALAAVAGVRPQDEGVTRAVRFRGDPGPLVGPVARRVRGRVGAQVRHLGQGVPSMPMYAYWNSPSAAPNVGSVTIRARAPAAGQGRYGSARARPFRCGRSRTSRTTSPCLPAPQQPHMPGLSGTREQFWGDTGITPPAAGCGGAAPAGHVPHSSLSAPAPVRNR